MATSGLNLDVKQALALLKFETDLANTLGVNDKFLVIEVRIHWAARGLKVKAYDWIKNRNW